MTDSGPLVSTRTVKAFRRKFPECKDTDVVASYRCAMDSDVLYQGHLFVTRHYLLFYGKLFTKQQRLILAHADITSMEKVSRLKVLPNGIKVATDTQQYVFTNFLSRDATYTELCNAWMEGKRRSIPSSMEANGKQRLGYLDDEDSQDDDSSTLDDAEFFTDNRRRASLTPYDIMVRSDSAELHRVTSSRHSFETPRSPVDEQAPTLLSPRQENLARRKRQQSFISALPASVTNFVQQLGVGSNNDSSVSSSTKQKAETSSRAGLLRGFSSRYDNSSAENTKSTGGKSDADSSSSGSHKVSFSKGARNHQGNSKALSATQLPHLADDKKLSTFGIHSRNRSVSSPVRLDFGVALEAPPTKAPALPPLPICCDCDSHEKHFMLDRVIDAPIDVVHRLLWLDDPELVVSPTHITRESRDLVFENWNPNRDGLQERVMTYGICMRIVFQKSWTPCVETQTITRDDPGVKVVKTVARQPEVPFGDGFAVKNQYCITHEGPGKSRVKVTLGLEFKRKIFIAGKIERTAVENALDYFQELGRQLENHVTLTAAGNILESKSSLNGMASPESPRPASTSSVRSAPVSSSSIPHPNREKYNHSPLGSPPITSDTAEPSFTERFVTPFPIFKLFAGLFAGLVHLLQTARTRTRDHSIDTRYNVFTAQEVQQQHYALDRARREQLLVVLLVLICMSLWVNIWQTKTTLNDLRTDMHSLRVAVEQMRAAIVE